VNNQIKSKGHVSIHQLNSKQEGNRWRTCRKDLLRIWLISNWKMFSKNSTSSKRG